MSHALPRPATLAPQPDTVPALLHSRVAATPDAVAFREQDTSGQWVPTSWQHFADQVGRLQRALRAAGLRRGDRLALIAPASLCWELLHHASLGLGIVVVGMDAHDLPARVADMLLQCEVQAIASSSLAPLEAVPASALARCALCLYLGAGPVPADAPVSWTDWPALDRLADQTDVEPAEPPAPGDTATIIFTSGTTGAPKGIAYDHGQVCLAVAAIGDAFSFVDDGGRLLCWLPLSNLFQRIVNLAALRQGPATYLLPDPRRVMDVVAEVAPDVFIGVPRFYEKLYAGLQDALQRRPPVVRALVDWARRIGRRAGACQRAGQPLPAMLALAWRLADAVVLRRLRRVLGDRLRCLVSGSAPMPLWLLEEMQALGWTVLESYGVSENILPMAMNRVDAWRLGSVGQVVRGNTLRFQHDGQIEVRGPGVFRGYLGDATGAAGPDPQGWHQTGDLGSLDAAGYLTLTGRQGDIIKTSTGRRIAPAAIEALLRGVPGIDQAVLLGAGRKCTVALCTRVAMPPSGKGGDSDGLGGDACATDRLAMRQLLLRHLAPLPERDRPGAVALLPGAFGIDTGELTPNLKLRRDVIANRHADCIAALYAAVDAGRSDRPDILVLSGPPGDP